VSFAGNLKTISLPDTFELILKTRMTGALKVTKDTATRQIFFIDGILVYASSNNEEDLFGNILVKKGRITREELNQILSEKSGEKKIGAMLVESNLLSQEEVLESLRMQIEEIVYSLFGWSDAQFEFVDGEEPPEDAILTEINPMNIIMEGTRRIDEWEELKKILPSSETIIRLAKDPSINSEEVRLSKNDIIVMALIGSGKKLMDVVEECFLERFITSKSIATMLQTGLIEKSEDAVNEKSAEEERKTLAELLAQIYINNLTFIFESIREKLGGKGEKVILDTFRDNENFYPDIDQKFINGKGEIQFDFFVEMYNKLPEDMRIWKIVSNFNSLMNDYLIKVQKSLGGKFYRRLLSEIRINIQNTINRHRQLSMKYGLEEEFSRILREI
jgi:hypothetical protein